MRNMGTKSLVFVHEMLASLRRRQGGIDVVFLTIFRLLKERNLKATEMVA
jgi:hypothetical protein